MVEHTPGPWHVGQSPHDHDIYAHPIHDLWRIADVSGGDPKDDAWHKRLRANAHLIAAAPDLLSALEFARQVVKDIDGLQISHGFWDYIDAAIRKARGEVQP